MVKHGTRLACIQSAWRESVSSGVATFGSPWRPLGKDSVLETAPAQSRALWAENGNKRVEESK